MIGFGYTTTYCWLTISIHDTPLPTSKRKGPLHEVSQSWSSCESNGDGVCTHTPKHALPAAGFRVNELRGIPVSNMEVVIFFVNGGGERCAIGSDAGSATGSSSTGGGSRNGSRRRGGAPKAVGPVSMCLWRPKKSGRDMRYLVTVAATPG